ncbi:ABC transporter substrate-binding protein [Pleionea sediminis]|uniref:ABC transporter substrate-binding protein n=1 Tax=Pleionea sediminis TaxID=2569479 RepID=UPI0013DE3D14|nr:ABC transporter substrate-binding protein [Pleionea sediminis]
MPTIGFRTMKCVCKNLVVVVFLTMLFHSQLFARDVDPEVNEAQAFNHSVMEPSFQPSGEPSKSAFQSSLSPSESRIDEASIKSLSIKELVNIPLTIDYDKAQIYQSDINQMGKKTVNYGFIVPISEYPAYSSEVVAAADMAAEYINQHGGINGRRLVLLRADDQENTPVSARLAKRLVEEFNVEAIIGPATSDSVADVLKRVALPKNIPMISHSASSMKLVNMGANHPFWRMVTNNQQQIKLMTEFMYQEKGHKKVFIFSGRGIYSEEIRQGVIDFYRPIKDTHTDFMAISNLVTLANMNLEDEFKAIQASGVTALLITLQNHQVIPILRKIKQHWRGDFPLIIIGDNATRKYLVDAQLGSISECILTYVASTTHLSPELQEKIMKQFDVDTSLFDAAYIYDATMLLAMGQTLAERFNLSMKEAVNAIASDGYPIKYSDFPNLIELYKKHKKFQYQGYSGRVHFNSVGDNLVAYMKLYPLAETDKNPPCLNKLSQ